MATVTTSGGIEQIYDKLESTINVGIGTLDYKLYSSKAYQKKKKSPLIIGNIARIVYSGFETDPTPTILTIAFESKYNTVIAFNLRYVPPKIRASVLDLVLKSNKANIANKKPLVVDYKEIIDAFPQMYGTIRRYKLVLIGVIESPIPLIGYPSVAKEKSPYTTIYKQGMISKKKVTKKNNKKKD